MFGRIRGNVPDTDAFARRVLVGCGMDLFFVSIFILSLLRDVLYVIMIFYSSFLARCHHF